MIDEDVVHVVMQTLAQKKAGTTFDELLDEVPYEKSKIIGAISLLTRHNLVLKIAAPEEDDWVYEANKELTPYQINKAVEIGVNIEELSKLLGISEKQRQSAFALSAQSKKLQELDEEQAKIRSKLLNQKTDAPRNMIVDALERLAEASESSIQKMALKEGVSEVEVRKALAEAKAQALKAIEAYQDQLSRGRGASVDDY